MRISLGPSLLLLFVPLSIGQDKPLPTGFAAMVRNLEAMAQVKVPRREQPLRSTQELCLFPESENALAKKAKKPSSAVVLHTDTSLEYRAGNAGGLGGRSGRLREKLVTEEGGNAASEVAVARGLRWLALHQAPAGNWSLDQFNLHARTDLNSNRFFNDNSTGKGMKNDAAGVAFGLLPFLATGITHKPSGRPQEDVYVKTVKRALEWMIVNQAKDGRFGGSSLYEHGLATIAICEAYGMTADPALKASAQKAINFNVQAQDNKGGGWRYQPRQPGDTSVLGWQLMALKSAQMAGLNVPRATLQMAEKFLASVEAPEGGYGYMTPQFAPATSAIGLLCRQYLGTSPRNAPLLKGVEKLLKTAPPHGQTNIYYEYHATQVCHHLGGDLWTAWNLGKDGKKGIRDILIARQEQDGSFSPKGDVHSQSGGRVMQTSLSLLTLEVYYRHLPLYQRDDPRK